MTSLSKVFLRTDRVMQNDFDCLSATITLLTVSGVLCAWGELLFKNPVHKVCDKFFFIAYFLSLLHFQDFLNLCYFPGFLRSLWPGFCVGVGVIVIWEHGAIS